MRELSPNVERALALCGRDRVMHRHQSGDLPPAVSIRWDHELIVRPEDDSTHLVREGATIDDAGYDAAESFAARLRELAEKYSSWADKIEKALA